MYLVGAIEETLPIEDARSAQYRRGVHAKGFGAWGHSAQATGS
jgi:hypothetical protein